MWTRILLIWLATSNAACGVMLQYAVGYDEEITRPATRTKRITLENMPEDATVERHGPDGVKQLGPAQHDEVTYVVSETVAIPKSRTPMYIGAALDAAAGAALTYLAMNSDNYRVNWNAAYAASYFGAGLIADFAFALIFPADGSETVLRYAPLEAAPVTYVARSPSGVYEQSVHVAWSDRLVFDPFPTRSTPGGPRIELPPAAPLPPPPKVATEPALKLKDVWYGWQLLPIDAAAFAAVGYGISQDNHTLTAVGIGVGALAPMLVHFGNGQSENTLASLGLRVGGPIGGGVVTGAFGALLGVFVGVLIDDYRLVPPFAYYFGLAGASAVAVIVPFADDFFLAWKKVDPEPNVSGSSLTVVPTAGVTPEGKPTFGLAGRF